MPDAIAGPSVRAGFIDAPVAPPPTSDPIATAPPIATPATPATARESVATAAMTNMRNAVRTIS